MEWRGWKGKSRRARRNEESNMKYECVCSVSYADDNDDDE